MKSTCEGLGCGAGRRGEGGCREGLWVPCALGLDPHPGGKSGLGWGGDGVPQALELPAPYPPLSVSLIPAPQWLLQCHIIMNSVT